jgi:hypothetical protein
MHIRSSKTCWPTEETISSSSVALAGKILPKEMQSETDQRKLVEAVRDWLERCEQPWLLIFDNADDPLLVAPYLPRSGNGSILLTTRDQAMSAFAAPLPVETLSEPEGIALLLKRAGRTATMSHESGDGAAAVFVALFEVE